MSVTITPERADSADAVTLITELEGYLAPNYPIESRHGLSVVQLMTEAVTFFVIRSDGTPAEYGELKRMYVRPQFRGTGLAKLLINHLAAHACERGVALLRLETGIYQQEAIGLYERMGFQSIPPFGAYKADPLSLFYEKPLRCGE
jgi:putative acetyltransferase